MENRPASPPRFGPFLHGCLFLLVLGVFALALPALSWPWHLLLPLLVYAAIVLPIPFLRRTAPRLAIGRLTGAPLAAAIVLSAMTSGVLLSFHALVAPDVSELGAKLPVGMFGNFILAGVCMSALNATLEELVFRGVLWETISAEWNARVGLVVTSIVFGVSHLHGYPPGPTGAVLAGLYGVALGTLRWWTGGLGLAIACHVCADATIFVILFQADALHLE